MIEEIVKKFLVKRYELNMGAGKLSKRYKVPIETIYEAKKRTKDIINSTSSTGSKLPKILILDIETAPVKGYVWRLWKEDVGFDRLISDWFMLTWSAKWLFDNEMYSEKLTPEEVFTENDKRIVSKLWQLLDEANIVVTHNGDIFDLPKINARFIVNGLPPISPYQSIDTKKIASKQFGFSSNKLDALALLFGFKPKLETSFSLWKSCMEGNEESLKYMEIYNNHDVELLEEIYLKLRPWIKGHPNIGLYMELNEPVCTNCGSTHLTHLQKCYITSAGKFELFRCECGAIGRRRQNIYDTDKKENLLVSLGN